MRGMAVGKHETPWIGDDLVQSLCRIMLSVRYPSPAEEGTHRFPEAFRHGDPDSAGLLLVGS